MKIKKWSASAAAVAMVVLGGNLVTAGAASADAGVWRSYARGVNPITSSSDRWVCGATRPVETDVFAQACALQQAGTGSRTGAVIVQNRRNTLYYVEAAVEVNDWVTRGVVGRWECRRSGVGPGTFSVCFGQWRSDFAFIYPGRGGANGVPLPGANSFV